MAALSLGSLCIAVSSENETCVVFKSGEMKCLQAPPPPRKSKIESNRKSQQQNSKNDMSFQTSYFHLVCSDISRCQKWLAFTSTSKYLCLWNLQENKLVSNRALIRAASQVKFAPSGNYIIVADKAGDVYNYSTQNPQSPGKLILGHLSVLLDVLITSDEKFIITCDRDEKIRTSCFPNCYNIKSFCLGHEEFITSIKFLPHDENILLSISGDGSLRMWNYIKGSQISVYECYKEINNGSLALTSLCTSINSSSSSLVCITLDHFKGCLVYNVEGNMKKLTISLIQILDLPTVPWCIKISNEKFLWFLSTFEKIKLGVKIWNKESNKFVNNVDGQTKQMIQIIDDQNFNGFEMSNIFALLYKQKFDNVQSYLEKKQERINSQLNHKKIKNN